MEDRAILLKIKRDFTENEAVQSLLKIIRELEVEIGMLRSEKEEAQYEIKNLKKQNHRIIEPGQVVKTKQEWLKEELVANLQCHIRTLEERLHNERKESAYYQNKYCVLAVQLKNSSAA